MHTAVCSTVDQNGRLNVEVLTYSTRSRGSYISRVQRNNQSTQPAMCRRAAQRVMVPYHRWRSAQNNTSQTRQHPQWLQVRSPSDSRVLNLVRTVSCKGLWQCRYAISLTFVMNVVHSLEQLPDNLQKTGSGVGAGRGPKCAGTQWRQSQRLCSVLATVMTSRAFWRRDVEVLE